MKALIPNKTVTSAPKKNRLFLLSIFPLPWFCCFCSTFAFFQFDIFKKSLISGQKNCQAAFCSLAILTHQGFFSVRLAILTRVGRRPIALRPTVSRPATHDRRVPTTLIGGEVCPLQNLSGLPRLVWQIFGTTSFQSRSIACKCRSVKVSGRLTQSFGRRKEAA